MKKILLIVLFPLMMLFGTPWGNYVQAQVSTVSIGSGSSSDRTLPFNMFYKNSFNQMIYYQREVGEAGYIGALSFAKVGTSSRTIQELTIWMALTPDSITTTSSWVPQASMKQVFHTTNFVMPNQSGDVLFTLDSAFYYDGTQNLAIVISRKDNGYNSSLKFKYTTTESVTCLYRASDSDVTTADYPGTTEGNVSVSRPNVKLYMNSVNEFCFPLPKIEVTSVNENEIGISWPTASGVSGYEVGIVEVNNDSDTSMASAITTSVTDANYTFTGLNANTEYLVGVRKECSLNSYSDWIMMNTRTTSTPIALPFECDFESEDDAANWTLDNGSVENKWVIDSSASYGEGSVYGMYVSNDTSVVKENLYTNNSRSCVFAKCLLQFVNAGEYNVEYDWKAMGESKFDFLRVMMVPAGSADVMVSGENLPSGVTFDGLPMNVIAVDGGEKLNLSADWQKFMGVIDIPVAGNYYLMFMWRNDNSGGNSPAAAVDNISVSQATCPSADSVTVTNITATSATITGYSTAGDNYILYYRALGAEEYDTLEITSPYILDGLNSGTFYEGMLCTNCGVEDQSYAMVNFQFGTNCETLSLPWSFDAEGTFLEKAGSSAKYPYCWEVVDAGSATVYSSFCWKNSTISSRVHSGNQSIYFSGSSSTSNRHNDWLISPMITFTGSEEISMWVKTTTSSVSASYQAYFGLYASNDNATDNLDTANFVPLTITGTNVVNNMVNFAGDDWQKITIQLPATLTGDHHLAFVIKDVNSYGFCIDDIYLYTVTTCAMPDSLHMTNISDNSATLAWSGNASSYIVYYGVQGCNMNEMSTVTSTQNSIELTNLNVNTTYEFRVVATCSDGVSSAMSAPVSFTTTCAPIATDALPFTEDFNMYVTGSTAPFIDCWFRGTNGSSVYPYVYENNYSHIENCLYFSSSSLAYCYVALPAFEEEISNLMLKCKVRHHNTASYNSALLLGVMTNPYDYSTFTVYDTLTPSTPGEWSEFMISLANVSAEDGKYIAFVLPQGRLNYSYLDDIEITTRGVCDSPMDVRLVDVSATSATVAWTDSVATRWNVYYGTPGFNMESVTPIAVVDTTVCEITDLIPQTDYEFFVVADCGDGSYSAASLIVPFTTSCAPIVTLPYIENFETYNSGVSESISPCWTKAVFGTTTQYPYPSSSAAINGNIGLYLNGYKTSSSEFSCYAALPLFQEDLSNLQLRFKMKNHFGSSYYTTYYSKIAMGVMTNPNDMSTFDTLMVYDMSTLPNGTVNTYEYSFNTYTGEGKYIAFYAMVVDGSGSVDNMVYIDDVEVCMIPSCQRPQDVETIAVTGSSAILTWLGNASSYEVKYSNVADMSNSSTTIVTGDTITLSNLTSYTDYYVNIRGICSAVDTSEWMLVPATFRTAMDCGEGYEYIVDTIGEGSTSSSNYVLNCNDYHRKGCNWTIFSADELMEMGLVGNNNIIKSISLNVDGTGGAVPFKMYMAETSVEEFNDNITDTLALSQMTLVFDDSIFFESNSWNEVILETPFIYTGDSNLMIAFERTASIDSDIDFFYSSTAKYRTAYITTSSYSTMDYRKQYRGNMIFSICADIPSCVQPRNVFVTDVNPNSVSLSWTGTATSYQIVYGEEMFDPNTVAASELISVTSNTTILQNLSTNTHYYIYMRSVCGTEYSSWTRAVEVKTPCVAEALPYIENFDSYIASTSLDDGQTINACWIKGTNGTNAYPYVYTTNCASSPNSLNFSSTRDNYSYVALPMFTEPINNLVTSFKLYKTMDDYGTMYIGVMVNPSDMTTFEHLATFKPTTKDVWEGFEYSFANYTGNGKFIAFVSPDSITSYVQLDDVEVFETPTCQSPINVTIDSISTNSAVVSWTDRSVNPTAGYQIEYGPQGFELGRGTRLSVTTNPTTITNLLVGTTYDVYVRALCSATDQSRWSFGATFSTDCGPVTLPVFYGFDNDASGTNATLPFCFSRYNDATSSYNQSYPYVSSSVYNVFEGRNYLYWNISSYSGPQNAAMIFPEIDIVNYPMDGNQIVFWAKRGSSMANIIVGIVDNTNSILGMTVVDTIDLTETYTEYTIPFTAYSGTHAYPVLLVQRGSSSKSVYVDNVTIEEIPACPRVYDLRAVTATATTATLGWTDTIGSTQWLIDYRQADSESITTIAVSTNPYTITGLTASTQYLFNVRPICASGDTSSAVRDDAIFWTTQVPATIPYTYNFEDATEWANWQTNSNCNINWYRGNAVAGQGTSAMYISTDEGSSYGSDWGRKVNAVAYRDIDFGTDTSSFTMIFKANVGGTIDHNYDGVSVLLVDPTESVEASTEGITTPWGHVNDVAISTVRHDTLWGTHMVHFERIAGVHRVAFYWFNQSTGDEHPYVNQPGAIDSISIVEPTCTRPYDLAVSNIEFSSVTLNWGGNASSYEVSYREAGADDSTEISQVVTSNSLNIYNLNPTTEYVFWVRAICSVSDTSYWSNAKYFKTICSRYVASDTIREDFTNWTAANYNATDGILPDCWEGYSNGTNDVLPHVVGGGSYWYAHEDKSLILTSGTGAYGDTSIVRLPYTVEPVNSLTLSFWMATESDTYGTLEIGYLTSDDIRSSFVPVKSICASLVTKHDGNGNQEAGVGLYDTIHFDSVPAEAQAVAFRWVKSSTFYSVCIDDVVLSANITCPAPIITSTTADHESVVINWNGSASDYELLYKATSATIWSDTIAVSGNTYTITGLQPETTYDVMLRALCGAEDGNSIWTEVNFTTSDLPCFTPTNLATSDIDYDAVTLQWDANENAHKWVVNVFNTTDNIMDTVEANPTTIAGLYPGIEYHAAVKSICSDIISSEWSDTITFTTKVCPVVTNVAISEITENSAKVTWTAGGEETAWQINYGLQDFGQGEGEMIDATATNYTLTGLEAETAYDVYVRAMCTDEFSSVWSEVVRFTTLETPEGIDGVEGNFQFAIYPNPTSGATTISLSGVEGKVTINVVDMNGRMVTSESIECGSDCEKRIDVTNLAQGTYFVRVLGDNINSVRKLIVR